MANVRITDLTELSAAPASGDELAIEDASANQTKKISITNLFSYVTGAVSTLVTSNLTASRALVSGSGGKVEVSSVTSTELGYLSGVTSNVQNQFDGVASGPVKNLLYNGNFNIWDRGTSASQSDDTYGLPGVNFLVSSGTLAISQQTSSPPEGSRYYLRCAPSGQSFGVVWFLEADDAIPLRGQTVSLSFYCASSSDEDINTDVLAWTSTADSITSDVIGTYTGPPFTPATNWTSEGDATHNATATFTRFTHENIALDTASFNNLAVVIWGLGIASSNIDIAQVQLEIGANATAFVPRPMAQERQLAYRRFIRWAGNASALGPAISGYASAGSEVHKYWMPFPVQMRAAPTGTVGGTWALTNCTGPTLTNVGVNGASMTATSSAAGAFSAATNGTDDYLQFDAEL